MCYTVTFLHVRVTIVAEETQQCLIYMLFGYMSLQITETFRMLHNKALLTDPHRRQ